MKFAQLPQYRLLLDDLHYWNSKSYAEGQALLFGKYGNNDDSHSAQHGDNTRSRVYAAPLPRMERSGSGKAPFTSQTSLLHLCPGINTTYPWKNFRDAAHHELYYILGSYEECSRTSNECLVKMQRF